MRSTGIYPASRLRASDYFQTIDRIPSLVEGCTYRVNEVFYHAYRDTVHMAVEEAGDLDSVFEVTMYLDDMVQIMRE